MFNDRMACNGIACLRKYFTQWIFTTKMNVQTHTGTGRREKKITKQNNWNNDDSGHREIFKNIQETTATKKKTKNSHIQIEDE